MQDGRQWVLSMLSHGDDKERKEIMMTSNCGYNLLFKKGWALCWLCVVYIHALSFNVSYGFFFLH